MRFYLTIITLTSILLLNGCNTNAGENQIGNSDKETITKAPSAKEYVDNNAYINVDIASISDILTNPLSRKDISEDDMSRVKAAVYRFYKNVTLDNGVYSCNLTSGEEINVSPEVFSALLDNLNEMNKAAQEIRDKGGKIETQIPDENYLNSLLQ